MNIEIPERHRLCSVCLSDLPEGGVTTFIDHGIVLLACSAHTKIAAELVDRMSKNLHLRRELTNDKMK
jgi:hypothetical protein